MLKKKKFIIAGVVLAVAFVFLFIFALNSSSVPYYNSVSELLAKGNSIYNQSLQVKGVVDQDSIDPSTPKLVKFIITDGTNNLPVIYHGNPTDAIRQPGQDIVVEGELTSDGSFQSSKILTKCPSKYEAEQP